MASLNGKSRLTPVNNIATQNTTRNDTSSVYVSNQPQTNDGSCLLLIDPQVDFVDATGSLCVAGAKDDCKRIAEFISDNTVNLQEIYVTLDTHMNFHIAHPHFWRGPDGTSPKPFEEISHEDVRNEKWLPVDMKMKSWCLEYTKALEMRPRLKGIAAFKLRIWPPHCLLGTPGHAVEEQVMKALMEWELANHKCVHYVLKGNNSKTEHYSAFRAEVIVPEDPATDFNENLYRDLMRHSKIYVAGEAKSHCVNFSVRDLVEEMTREKAIKKIILLEGGMSPVTHCEDMGDAFIRDMKSLLEPKAKEKIADASTMSIVPEAVGLRTMNLKEGRVIALGEGMYKSTP